MWFAEYGIFKSRVYRVTCSTCDKLLEKDSFFPNCFFFFFFFMRTTREDHEKKSWFIHPFELYDSVVINGYILTSWYCSKTQNDRHTFVFKELHVDRHVSFRRGIIAWSNDTLLMRIPLRMWCTLGTRSPWKREPIKTDEKLQRKEKKEIRKEQT